MKRKNGFTLIELLAVIVILAIIAVIATPIIVGIIEDSRKAAFERSVEGIIHATDLDYSMQDVLENSTYEIENGQIKDKTLKTPIKNLEGFNGKIVYDENGNSQFAIHNGKWCMMKDSSGVVSTTEYVEGGCIIVTPLSEACFETEDLEDGGVAIVDYLCDEKNVVIPNTINGKEVKAITGKEVHEEYLDGYFGAFEDIGETRIATVKLPNTVTIIGKNAFSNNGLSGELDLSNTNIVSIGDWAFVNNQKCEYDEEDNFLGCVGITSVKLPRTITNIGEYAFTNNGMIGELDLSNTQLISIGTGAFEGCDHDDICNQISSLKLPNTLKVIGEYAFSNNAISGNLDLSSTSIISIGEHAFSYNNKICEEVGWYDVCSGGITSIKLPSTVTSIGAYAFSDSGLKGELDLSNTQLTSIGEHAFSFNGSCSDNGEEKNCWDAITNIKLPSSVTSIGDNAFSYNSLNGELDLSNLINLSEIVGFGYNKITSIKLPDNVTSIGEDAFADNAISGVLDLSNTNIAIIKEGAFISNRSCEYDEEDNFNCIGGITNIKLPISVKNINDHAFLGNSFNGELDLSNLINLVSIGEHAFTENVICEYDENWNEICIGGITSLKIPSNVTNIGNSAFSYNNLESVTFVGRTNLDGVTLGSSVWGWAEGYSDANIGFSN